MPLYEAVLGSASAEAPALWEIPVVSGVGGAVVPTAEAVEHHDRGRPVAVGDRAPRLTNQAVPIPSAKRSPQLSQRM